jgi:hypothetical protein
MTESQINNSHMGTPGSQLRGAAQLANRGVDGRLRMQRITAPDHTDDA